MKGNTVKKHYTLQNSKQGGIEMYKCNYCMHKSKSLFRFQIHMEVFHPEKLQSEITYKELVSLAKENEISYQGNKQQIAERLQREGIL